MLKVRGATSFEYLRTVNGTVCETFQSTAFKLGFLHEDEEWEICLKEAESEKVSTQYIRDLFAIIRLNGSPAKPATLLQNHIECLCEDYLYQERKKLKNENFQINEKIKQMAYASINQYLHRNQPT